MIRTGVPRFRLAAGMGRAATWPRIVRLKRRSSKWSPSRRERRQKRHSLTGSRFVGRFWARTAEATNNRWATCRFISTFVDIFGKWSSTKKRRGVMSPKDLPVITRWSYHLSDRTSFDTPIGQSNWRISLAPDPAAGEVTRGTRGPAILGTYCTRNSSKPVVPVVRQAGRHRPHRRQALTRAYLGPNEALTGGAAYRAPLPPGGLGSASRLLGVSPSQSAARASLRSR